MDYNSCGKCLLPSISVSTFTPKEILYNHQMRSSAKQNVAQFHIPVNQMVTCSQCFSKFFRCIMRLFAAIMRVESTQRTLKYIRMLEEQPFGNLQLLNVGSWVLQPAHMRVAQYLEILSQITNRTAIDQAFLENWSQHFAAQSIFQIECAL